MKYIVYSLIGLTLLITLVSCSTNLKKETKNNNSTFLGTWEKEDHSGKKIIIESKNENSFILTFKKFDLNNDTNLTTKEQSNEELILESSDQNLIYSFYIIDNNHLEFYFSTKTKEKNVGESPPIKVKRIK